MFFKHKVELSIVKPTVVAAHSVTPACSQRSFGGVLVGYTVSGELECNHLSVRLHKDGKYC